MAVQTDTKGERGITWKLSNLFFFLIPCINPTFSCDFSSYARMKRLLISDTYMNCTSKSHHISIIWQFISLLNFHQIFYLFNYFHNFDYCQFTLAILTCVLSKNSQNTEVTGIETIFLEDPNNVHLILRPLFLQHTNSTYSFVYTFKSFFYMFLVLSHPFSVF